MALGNESARERSARFDHGSEVVWPLANLHYLPAITLVQQGPRTRCGKRRFTSRILPPSECFFPDLGVVQSSITAPESAKPRVFTVGADKVAHDSRIAI